MFNADLILKKIEEMSAEEAALIVSEALEQAGIVFEKGTGEIYYESLPVSNLGYETIICSTNEDEQKAYFMQNDVKKTKTQNVQNEDSIEYIQPDALIAA